MNITEPERGLVPSYASSRALPRPGPDGLMPAAMQMAARLQTIMVDLAVDGADVLYGRPRSAVGYATRLDGPALADWGRAHLPAWQDLDTAGWAETARRLAEWVQRRDAAAIAATPADARKAAELAAERVRAARRAELELQAAEAAAELAAFADAPPEVEPTRRGGWMRRPAAP